MNTEDLEPLLLQRIVGVGYANGVLLICTDGREWYFKVNMGELELEQEWSQSPPIQ